MHKTLEQKKEECLSLLRSTDRPKIEDLITHLTNMGYFIAPGSLKHHRFEGGLVSHSLETYHKAMEYREGKIQRGVDPDSLPVKSVIISALLHDVCKADILRFNKETRTAFVVKKFHGHSSRSVRKIGESGFHLTPEEKDAILWHMGGKRQCEDKAKRYEHFQTHPLSDIICKADGHSIGEAKKRHHPQERDILLK